LTRESTPIQIILDRLAGVRGSGRDRWEAHCPAHEDRRRSLSVAVGESAKVLLKCHAGCPVEQIVAALELRMTDLFRSNGRPARGARGAPGRIVAMYDYRDERGVLLFQAVRFDPKDFRLRRPSSDSPMPPGATLGRGARNWCWTMAGVRRVLYRLPELHDADAAATVYVAEGERDADALAALGLVATTNPGGAGKWRLEYGEPLRGRHVVIVPDNDDAGQKHADQVAEMLANVAASVRVVSLPRLPEKGDVSDWLTAGGTREQLEALAAAAPVWGATAGRRDHTESTCPAREPWARAVSASRLLVESDADVEWIAEGIAAPGSIVGLASPRGLAKTHLVHALAVAVARGGPFRGAPVRPGRVLLIDRDNSRRELRRRLREWCSGEPPDALEVLTRDDAPALTDWRAWTSFPFTRYAVVILDSLGAATEGVSEQDGGETGAALAPLLDLARRGPAVVVLLNVPKDGANYRGSGVIADRLDVLYEVRDATDLAPVAADEVWWSQLPEAGEAAWAARAKRRGRRDDYRLVLVPSKFRIGEEPDPIALEVDLTPGAWTLRDVTASLEAAHEQARGEASEAARAARQRALDTLATTVRTRAAEGRPLRKREAEDALASLLPGVRRAARRALVEDGADGRWCLEAHPHERGRPQVLVCTEPPFRTATAEITGRPKPPAYSSTSTDANSADRGNGARPESPAQNPSTGTACDVRGFGPSTWEEGDA
jgi:hypothetical protein